MSEFSPSAAETSDMQLVPTTASIAFVWSAATPPSCLPHNFRAEARTHFTDRLEDLHEKKRYQIQHPHGSGRS